MMVHAKWSSLRQSRWYDYALRFALGGLVTAMAGAIAAQWGPTVGGLFLAFPAIFCASATLIEKHERERKQQHGVKGFRRGTDAAALDAAGTGLGSIGLAGFALTVWLLIMDFGYATLMIAAVAWFLVSVACWRLRQICHRSR
jgi:hypothetical protein